MNMPSTIRRASPFMRANIPVFLARFSLSYYLEDCCVEYFIKESCSQETVSYALILSYNRIANALHISRFYPELFRQSNPKYMSAACFYLIIHHCANAYALGDTCHITLETAPEIHDIFYSRLKDFNFQIRKHGLGGIVELTSDLVRLPVDTSMIKAHVFEKGEIPFLK